MSDAEYQPSVIESKWQNYWDQNGSFKVTLDPSKPKYYILDMFPYPSGDGLHVGHPEGYTATDILARYKRMRGFNVLHPMGWDAFGLPAERFAMKTGTHPAKRTEECIRNFKRQIKRLGFSYDWSREINTTDPKYYKWTQWIFKKLYEKGLAYIAEQPVWWSDHYKTVLANEEVVDGQFEGHPVRKMKLKQWVLKITAYAERLLKDLELVEWPTSTKEMQKNWIGYSEGASIQFSVVDPSAPSKPAGTLEVFTTRPDTLFGATFMVVAPEHPLLDQVKFSKDKQGEIQKYRAEAAQKSDLARTDLAKTKSGIDSGLLAVNPANGKSIPVYVADYVLISYGTGAIMAVPGHDERDFEFAKKYSIPIQRVVAEDVKNTGQPLETAFVEDGVAVNSGFLNGFSTNEAKSKMLDWLEKEKKGKRKSQYKLRDWLFSRQRYWGEPFPIIHTEEGFIELVDDSNLPVELPQVANYEPSSTGESPLANKGDWLQVKTKSGKKGRRETNTMPQWAGSCWYYLRFLDPLNDKAAWDPKVEKYWMPVDLYVGGSEHAVLHLLYARFWHKVLYDCGLVSTPEPFKRLIHQGMILGSDGEKMSKSRGNVVNPDEVVEKYGADAFRMYEMFMGPLEKTKPWSTQGLEGTSRFLTRIFRFVMGVKITKTPESEWSAESLKLIHKLVYDVTEDCEGIRLNTAIAKMMEFINEVNGWKEIPKEMLERFVLLLSPFAPHLGEELWQYLGHKTSLVYEPWPKADPKYLIQDTIEMGVQINGKMRGTIQLSPTASEEEALSAALAMDFTKKYVSDRSQLKKVIYKAGRILNLIC